MGLWKVFLKGPAGSLWVCLCFPYALLCFDCRSARLSKGYRRECDPITGIVNSRFPQCVLYRASDDYRVPTRPYDDPVEKLVEVVVGPWVW